MTVRFPLLAVWVILGIASWAIVAGIVLFGLWLGGLL